ncbi:hypothetical protein [Haladaptatus sp. NG-WS-4]
MPIGGSLVNSVGKQRSLLLGKLVLTAVIVVVGSATSGSSRSCSTCSVRSSARSRGQRSVRFDTKQLQKGTKERFSASIPRSCRSVILSARSASGAIASATSYELAYLSVAVVWGLDALVLACAFAVDGERITAPAERATAE